MNFMYNHIFTTRDSFESGTDATAFGSSNDFKRFFIVNRSFSSEANSLFIRSISFKKITLILIFKNIFHTHFFAAIDHFIKKFQNDFVSQNCISLNFQNFKKKLWDKKHNDKNFTNSKCDRRLWSICIKYVTVGRSKFDVVNCWNKDSSKTEEEDEEELPSSSFDFSCWFGCELFV